MSQTLVICVPIDTPAASIAEARNKLQARFEGTGVDVLIISATSVAVLDLDDKPENLVEQRRQWIPLEIDEAV